MSLFDRIRAEGESFRKLPWDERMRRCRLAAEGMSTEERLLTLEATSASVLEAFDSLAAAVTTLSMLMAKKE